MKFKTQLWCVLFILTLTLLYYPALVKAQGTYSITGSVVDERGLPMPGTVVFVNGSKGAVASDTNGRYTIHLLSPGTYEVVAKMIGYKPFLKQVAVTGKSLSVDISLEPNPQELKEVIVKPDKVWFKRLEIFKRNFLGRTDNAMMCKILNAEALFFDYDKRRGILKASANRIINIKNEALGYQINYLLTNFEYNENTNAVSYEGYPYFENLKGSAQQQEEWHKRQKIAYQGSVSHFIKSLFDDSLKQQGFLVYRTLHWTPLSANHIVKRTIDVDTNLLRRDSLITSSKNGTVKIYSENALYIVYTKEKESWSFQPFSLTNLDASRQITKGQVTVVDFFQPVTIEARGIYNPTIGLYFEGYMGWEKVGDLMPSGFQSGYSDRNNQGVHVKRSDL